MYRIVFLLFSSLLLLACIDKKPARIALPYYNEPEFSPIFIQNEQDIAGKIQHQIRDFTFLDQDSNLITQKDIEGKIHVANFIFTSCGSICPTMTRNLKLVSDQFRGDASVVFLSYSVTPWIDKAFVLKRYKKDNQINNDHWHFLTGNKNDIYQLARTSYYAEEEIGFSKDSTDFLHTEHLILVDKNKRIRGIYNGTLSLEMKGLAEDIKNLQSEK